MAERTAKGGDVNMKGSNLTALATDLWDFERRLVHPHQNFAGVDEAGRGALAGPVVAAAVILGGSAVDWEGVADSKVLTKRQREHLYNHVQLHAIAVGVGIADPSEIDELNILHASRLAMARALYNLKQSPDIAVIDGPYPPMFRGLTIPSIPVVDGDAKCLSVSAASIIAKVERDRMMTDLHSVYPEYGFHRNVGYPTADHISALNELGPCEVHRQSYRPVRKAAQKGLDLQW